MRINSSGLDEMQKAKRNSIGYQMFMLMTYALLLDSILYGAGVRWLNYPTNIMVIVMACLGIYLVITIATNAYSPPKAQNRKTVITTIIVVMFAVVLAIAAYTLFGNSMGQPSIEDTNDNSAFILMLVSTTGLLISLVVAIIKKVQDRNNGED